MSLLVAEARAGSKGGCEIPHTGGLLTFVSGLETRVGRIRITTLGTPRWCACPSLAERDGEQRSGSAGPPFKPLQSLVGVVGPVALGSASEGYLLRLKLHPHGSGVVDRAPLGRDGYYPQDNIEGIDSQRIAPPRSGRAPLRHPARPATVSCALCYPTALRRHVTQALCPDVWAAAGSVTGRPLSSDGSPRTGSPPSTVLGDAPTPQRPFYRTPLVGLRGGYPPVRLCSSLPPGRTLAAGQELYGAATPRPRLIEKESRGLSRSRQPFCAYAVFLDPGGNAPPLAVGRSIVAPGLATPKARRGFGNLGAQEHGVDTGCLRFAGAVTSPHARLASGHGPGLPGGIGYSQVATKGFRDVSVTSLPPFPSFRDAKAACQLAGHGSKQARPG